MALVPEETIHVAFIIYNIPESYSSSAGVQSCPRARDKLPRLYNL